MDLLSKMLQKDPEKRITAKEALNHDFFLNTLVDDNGIVGDEILDGEKLGKIVFKE